MPRKRQIAKLAHRQLSWDDVFVGERLDFWVGWRPPTNEFDRSRAHWLTWEEFLGDWSLVRAQALAEWATTQAERLAAARDTVAQRAAWLERAANDASRDLYARLLEEAERWVEEQEREEAPFAERAFQRVLAGEAPEGDESAAEERQARVDQHWRDTR